MIPLEVVDQPPAIPSYYYAKQKGYDPILVDKVWKEAERQGVSPTLVVSMVAHESQFVPTACNSKNKNGTNDWGLFQLNSYYHNQFRGNLDKHIEHGVKLIGDNIRRYGTLGGLGIYNAGMGKDSQTLTNKAVYIGKILKSYRDMEKVMAGYKQIDPGFKMTMWSETELQTAQVGGS